MPTLDNLKLQFSESMSGELKSSTGHPASTKFDVQIRIGDLGHFLHDPDHAAELTGSISIEGFGDNLPIRDGLFNLFRVDAATGQRRMTYAFDFTLADGAAYSLRGEKKIVDDPGMDVVGDMTRLFTTIIPVGAEEPELTGELRFNLRDAPSLVASMQVEGATSWCQRIAAYTAFTSFAFGALRDTYLADVNPFYDTQYENLVLSGQLDGGERFFFVSGTHDKGFPWGDSEIFWDVLLMLGDERFAVTDRVLEGLDIDVEKGSYRYHGELFAIRDGYSASFRQMRTGAPHVEPVEAEIEITFEAAAFNSVPFPFPLVPKLVRRLSSELAKTLREALPSERPLGIHITPHSVAVSSGTIRIGDREWRIAAHRTAGEAERGSFRNLKEPTLLYHYFCSPAADGSVTRIQIQSSTLRDEREHWVKDRLDAFLGAVVNRTASAEMRIQDNQLNVTRLQPAGQTRPFEKLGSPIVEVNNDHFPTGIFQRRIVRVADASGIQSLALEEDMSLMRLESINSDRKVPVAVIRDDDKFLALDRVLDATGFFGAVEAHLASAGKDRKTFTIAIKPNFMFTYNKRDRSTFTDPELVDHLVRRLRDHGFESIMVVEAQSTYGEYFDKRGVREVASYVGYDESAGYLIVDMTQDAVERIHLGPHLGLHPVSQAWKDADYRISFAKNKTHAYSYYTLTLKNVYGALPLANKFKEYHCDRDIYHTTIEYLRAFPVHYGLIDAYLSADGPFGIFADPDPNPTHAILGGPDLVAVDWVGATKMGIDPLISPYMRLAVEAFGKPAIQLIGDPNPYRPWLNVPAALPFLAHKGLDANHYFGNLIYMVTAQMDETHFTHKHREPHIRLLRKLTVPLRRATFVRTNENPSLANRLLCRLFYRLGH